MLQQCRKLEDSYVNHLQAIACTGSLKHFMKTRCQKISLGMQPCLIRSHTSSSTGTHKQQHGLHDPYLGTIACAASHQHLCSIRLCCYAQQVAQQFAGPKTGLIMYLFMACLAMQLCLAT